MRTSPGGHEAASGVKMRTRQVAPGEPLPREASFAPLHGRSDGACKAAGFGTQGEEQEHGAPPGAKDGQRRCMR
jgi:hypothetical protein